MAARDRNLDLATGAGSREEPDAGLAWFTQQCIDNGAPLERYVAHAELLGDQELATFFRRALAESHRARPGDRRRWARRRGDRPR
ncbi:MAG TPA: hypothetical protein VMA77_30000 [Solirubrobacteraceae bacterium]|nr:hypothetical protein [Solirubrobacteraceae bacterium]